MGEIVFGYRVLPPEEGRRVQIAVGSYLRKRADGLERMRPGAKTTFMLAYQSNEIAQSQAPDRITKMDVLARGVELALSLQDLDPGFFEIPHVIGRNTLLVTEHEEDEISERFSSRRSYEELEAVTGNKYPLSIERLEKAEAMCEGSAKEETALHQYSRILRQERALGYKKYTQHVMERIMRRLSKGLDGKFASLSREEIEDAVQKNLISEEEARLAASLYVTSFDLYSKLIGGDEFLDCHYALVALGNFGWLLALRKDRKSYEMARDVLKHAQALDPRHPMINERLNFVEGQLAEML